jgi:hypothetical protein
MAGEQGKRIPEREVRFRLMGRFNSWDAAAMDVVVSYWQTAGRAFMVKHVPLRSEDSRPIGEVIESRVWDITWGIAADAFRQGCADELQDLFVATGERVM